MMFSWCSVFFVVLISVSHARVEFGGYHRCSATNYTSNSIYHKNLKTLLASLSSDKDINYGFYNLSVGEGDDRVHAIALCRGDISQTACHGCLDSHRDYLLQRCAASKEGIVLYDNCTLRYYSNRSTLQSWEETFGCTSKRNNVSSVSWFNRALGVLLGRLQDQASMGDSRKKFAVLNTTYFNNSRIYGLAQCTPDLTELQCKNCLERLFRTYTGADTSGGCYRPSCQFRYETFQFYEIQQPLTPLAPSPTPLAPPPTVTNLVPPTGNNRNKKRRAVIIASVLASVALFIAICVLILLKKRKAKLGSKGHHVFLLSNSHDIMSIESLQYNFEIIRVATDNFNNESKLGEGGFGSVYKGKLVDGKLIAVKRLAAHSGQGDTEFTNEVVLVAKLQHRNLVRLLGYCLEGNERLLVYEFVPNSSLDRFLFGERKVDHQIELRNEE